MIFFLISSVVCRCEVFVMAPLDMFDNNQNPSYLDKFKNWCQMLRDGQVDGIMIDVWWGLVEKSPKNYNWNGYITVFNAIKEKGLKIIPVLSFHKCGGNVGDTVNIPIPSFVFEGSVKPVFVDPFGNTDDEYISFSYDDITVGTRTPLQMYQDFMEAFKTQFSSMLNDNTICEIEVGLGPCGELRYPSYLLSRWSYPGCGAFQSYDDMFKKHFLNDAAAAGHSDWKSPPTNVGDYNVKPGGSEFWNSGWNSDYGKFFQEWYAQQLIDHGSNVLKIARSIFQNNHLSAKISGIHWHYTVPCHCAESTAGFYNSNGHDGYDSIIQMFKRHNVDVCFTCLEMKGRDDGAGSEPEALVRQVLQDTKKAGLRFEGENALERYDWDAYNQIKNWVGQGLVAFTYLRLTDTLMNSNNWEAFKSFTNQMHNA